VPDPPTSPPPPEGRLSTGNPGVDAMLEGGLPPHRPYLIVGPSGTGKTKLALQFLCEGVRRGERVLLVTVEEPPNEVRLNHRALLPDLDRVEVFDAIPDVMRYERAPFKDIASVRQITPFSGISAEIRRSPELSSVEVTITALEQMLRSEVARRGYSRIAVDSLTALQYFCMKGFDPVGGAQTFLRFLSDLRTTAVLTVESPLEDVETTERALARGEIRLFRWELDGVTVRAIGVEKLRGSSHDVRLHPYRIGPTGIDVNLPVTISRDTRQIVEAPPTVVAPVPAAAPPLLEPLSEEVRDLVSLGVDVGPVRGVVEAAIAAVRAGRTELATQELSRLASLTGSLTATAADATEGSHGPASPVADAQRRIAQRADSIRVGLPPTAPPAPDVLEEQLDRVLAILPTNATEPAGATAPPTSVAAPTAVAEPSSAPSTEVPLSGGAPTPVPKEPASLEPSRPSIPEPAASSPVPAAPELPSLPTPPVELPPSAPVAPPRDLRETVPRPAPSRTRSPPPPPVVSMPEPPPLPEGLPRPPAPAAPAGRAPSGSPVPSVPAPTPAPRARSSTAPVPPPLPSVAPLLPEPTAAPREPEFPTVAPKRRKRTVAPRKKSSEAGEAVPTPAPPTLTAPAATAGEGAPAPAPKPKRRSVRKRKAPPVVAATAEPLPAPDPEAARAPPPSGGA